MDIVMVGTFVGPLTGENVFKGYCWWRPVIYWPYKPEVVGSKSAPPIYKKSKL